MDKLTTIEKKVLKLRQVEGYSIEETLKIAKISKKVFKDIIDKLKEVGVYDEEQIKKAKRNKKRRENYEKNKDKTKLSPEEESYKKKCIDFLCVKYFNYNETHEFNPILVKKLSDLYNKISSYKVIYNTILSQESNLSYANKKSFSSEYQKIIYMIAIIRNNLAIVWKKMQKYEEEQRGFNNRINDNEIVKQLNKKVKTKPTKRVDMTQYLD